MDKSFIMMLPRMHLAKMLLSYMQKQEIIKENCIVSSIKVPVEADENGDIEIQVEMYTESFKDLN
jgi:hypothetical protein